jgi:glycosyltransferase involved in cell wall biosynthesis
MYWNGHDKNGLKMNPQIFKSVRQADMVVFQSDFCKRCCEHHAGQARSSKVIHNAIDQSVVSSIPAASLGPGPHFVACAKWRPTKRPKSICKGFLESGVSGFLNMVGAHPLDSIEDKRIRWLGEIPSKAAIGVMKACDYAIHLGKFDPCPNVVIEELSCGLPVLHTDNGGTPELVKQDGVCLEVEAHWDYSISHAEIDNLDPSLVGKHIRKLSNMPKIAARDDLDIRHTARMYLKAFEELLNG